MAVLPQSAPSLQLNDKFAHIIAFATLGVLGGLAYPKTSLLILFTALITFGALIEFVQAIPALGRAASVEDWIADTAAAGSVLAILGLWRRLTRASE